MHFARIDDVTLHYRHRPVPGAPHLVFVNSLGTDLRIWEGVESRLHGEWSTLCFDNRGHGLSGLGKPPYKIEELADDLAGLMDHLNIRRAAVCGLSVGGQVAQAFYAKHPARVEALVLCDTAHKIGTPDFWKARLEALAAKSLEGVADTVLERWFTKAFRSGDQARLDGYRTMLVRQTLEGYAGTCAALRDADFTASAPGIAAPTLCLVGDEDGSTPPDLVRSLADLIPGSRFEIIAGAGHIPCVEQPEALAQLIRAFLSEALDRP